MAMGIDRRAFDQDDRDRVAGDLATTFLLEAGAGTGKTRVLVERYVRCVLDPERGAGDVRAVAAITFTEKAAGELRQRVREEFERRVDGAPAGSREAELVRNALDALDDAPISTIHGFAGRLLREFPVEAGVDPAFEQLDQLGAELERGRLWEEWLTELAKSHAGAAGGAASAASERGRKGLSRLLRAGVRLEALRELAVASRGIFGERYDIDPVGRMPVEPDLRSGLGELAGPMARLREYCAAACTDQTDHGLDAAMRLVEGCELLLEERPVDVDRIAAALFALPAKTPDSAPGGRKGSWSAAHGGKDELQARYRTLAGIVGALTDEYAEFLTGTAVAVADAFSRWAGATQLSLGRLDFTDLLGCLRDLLARDVDARRVLQHRHRYLLVDEFQDTDPLQAEIVFLLCEREPLAGDWREVVLEPGKLFVVGDPKQSIYRFRRADIAMYDEVKALVRAQPGGSGEVLAIRQNFRTTPSLVGWVNNVFSDVFDDDREEGRQPGYQWLKAYRPAAAGPRVAVLRGRDYSGAAGETDAARRDEARAVASLLAGMRGEDAGRWVVQDRNTDGSPGGDPASATGEERLRPPRWGDIAVLYRATTGLETLEDALRDAGVPYRVEGGATYFARREVDDALVCLRAVNDPSDGPAVYGALHSTLFGFSDDELVAFGSAGGRFDFFFEEQPEGHEAVGAALATLRRLHERRGEKQPHESAEELLRLAHASEFLAATGPGAVQAMANLEQLIDRARAFSGAGGGGLGSFLEWAAGAGAGGGEQESQVDDEGDVVHLLTIHKAKGLEYPIVVVVGGALGGYGGGGEPIVDRASRRVAIKLKTALPGAPDRDLEPHSYRVLKEREKRMAESEARRLLYVATTRARDRLVVSVFGALANKDGTAKSVMLGPVAASLPEAAQVGEACEDGGVLVLPPGEMPSREASDAQGDAREMIAGRVAWREARETLLAEASSPARATSPSGLEHVDEEVRSGGPGAPPGRAGALALGSAVHRVMELCDLDDEASIARHAAAAASEVDRPDLAARAGELALACWRSDPVRRAAAVAAADPEAVHRELPVGVFVDGVVVSGAVDLLYRDGGEWVVVDYKTDRAADAEVLLDRYRPQGAVYAVAVEAATGGVVGEVVFIAAAADGLVVRIPVDDRLRALARREVGAAAGDGRAVCPDELAPD